MGGATSNLAWEQKLLSNAEPGFGYKIPNSEKPGYSYILGNPAVKGELEEGCLNSTTGKHFYTLWDCLLRGSEIAGKDGNLLGTRKYTVETNPDPHTDKSRLPKNYVPTGYVEHPNGTVKRGELVWDTYQEVIDMSLAFGRGLVSLGCKEFDNIGVFSTNRAEWIIGSLGFYTQRMRTVALYATHGPTAIQYIIEHAELPVVISSQENLQTVLKSLGETTTVKHVIVIDCISNGKYGNTLDVVQEKDKELFKQHGVNLLGFSEVLALGDSDEGKKIPTNMCQKDDIAYLMYTSGTTGNPRGVLLTHNSVTSTLGCIRYFVPAFPHIYFSYLPLAHILETVVQVFVWTNGGTVGFGCGDIRQLVDDLQVVEPTLLPGVPRVFLKFYQSVMAQVEKKACIARWLIKRGLSTQMNRIYNNQPLDEFYDSKVFSVMREKIGLRRIMYALSGGAPCPSYVAVFMKCLVGRQGAFMEGYGCTECSAGSAVSDPTDNNVGSIGCPLAVNRVRLMDLPEMNYLSTNSPPTGELHITGPNLFEGYFKDDESTKAALYVDEEGRKWLRTGDVARFNPNGSISIIDRAKQLIKLSQGEYVAIEKVEDQYGQSPLVCQIWCYGNAYKPYIVAVVVPNVGPLHEYAVEKGWWNKAVPAPIMGNLSEVVIDEFKRVCTEHYDDLQKWIFASLKQHEQGLQGFEKIKAITIEYNFDSLGQAFNEANGLQTPTMKKRRRPLTDYYLETLQKMYISLGETLNEGEKW